MFIVHIEKALFNSSSIVVEENVRSSISLLASILGYCSAFPKLLDTFLKARQIVSEMMDIDSAEEMATIESVTLSMFCRSFPNDLPREFSL